MIKQICILTKSYKHGGFCVAGIDVATKEWVRIVNSTDPNTDELRKEQLLVDGKVIECLDVIEYDFIQNVPNACQVENWLLNARITPRYIKTLTLEDLVKIIKLDRDNDFILNNANLLNADEIKSISRSLYIYHVKSLKIDATTYESYGEIKFKYKCSFVYNDKLYSNISLTDPIYRDISNDGVNLDNALIITSLPCVPYGDGLYYKFVAKIIPINPELLVKNDGCLKIMKEGFFYSVYGNDALLLNKYFGYKLFGTNVVRTGFPVKNRETVFAEIDKLAINYDIYHYGNLVKSKRFPDNNYEIIDSSLYIPNSKSPRYEYFDIKRSDLLKVLASGTNPITGEKSDFIDSKTRLALLDIAKMIEKREKLDNGFKVKISDYNN